MEGNGKINRVSIAKQIPFEGPLKRNWKFEIWISEVRFVIAVRHRPRVYSKPLFLLLSGIVLAIKNALNMCVRIPRKVNAMLKLEMQCSNWTKTF
jgi:hypothetical protein